MKQGTCLLILKSSLSLFLLSHDCLSMYSLYSLFSPLSLRAGHHFLHEGRGREGREGGERRVWMILVLSRSKSSNPPLSLLLYSYDSFLIGS